MLRLLPLAALAALVVFVSPAGARVLHVGPGTRYPKPCAAIAAAHSGDRIEIDARGNGGYDGDVCAWSTDRLHLVGVHGRARIDAAGRTAQGKGIWVIGGARTVVERVELSGAHLEGDRNGAGIRLQAPGLTVRDSVFHDDDDGILADADPRSDVLIESSVFFRNGFGDGYSHNIYIGHVRRFTLRYSVSRDARVGHLVKSRADVNVLLANRLTGEGGTDSYEVDLPDGGLAYVIGNVIQQGPRTENPTMVSFGAESLANPRSRLYVVNNTFVDGRGGTAVHVAPSAAGRALVANNISTGSRLLVDAAGARTRGNCVTAHPAFAAPPRYDYHLLRRSPCVDAGIRLGRGLGRPLTPTQQYVETARHRARRIAGRAIDAGAFETASRR